MRTRHVPPVFWLFAASTSLLAGTISVQPAAPTETVGLSFTLSVVISGASDLEPRWRRKPLGRIILSTREVPVIGVWPLDLVVINRG